MAFFSESEITTEGKVLLTPRHVSNTFSEARASRMLVQVDSSKSGLPVVINEIIDSAVQARPVSLLLAKGCTSSVDPFCRN